MIISHEHRFIFIKTRKTAGTSLEVYLAGLAGADAVVTAVEPPETGHEPRNWQGFFNPLPEATRQLIASRGRLKGAGIRRPFRDSLRRRKYLSHITAQQVRDRAGRRVWNDYFKFCFERNPWDKTISWYWWATRGRGEPDFETWLGEKHWLTGDWGLYTINDAIAVDFIGRYEHLHDDLGTVAETLHLDTPAELPRAKGGYRASRPIVPSERADSRIGEIFRREIEHFGFSRPAFDGVSAS